MAKRKNNKLKIKLATSGIIYYYLKGRRLKSLEGKAIQAEQFEKRSIAAKKSAANTYKFQGRPIPRIYAVLLQKIHTKVDLKIMDLSKWELDGKPIFTKYSDILRAIDNASKLDSKIFSLLTEMGYFKDKEGRTALIDICEILKQKEYDKFKFILMDADGDEVRGRVRVCVALTNFEVAVTTGLKKVLGLNVVKTYFDYSPKYDFKNKIFELDISDQDPETNQDNRFDFSRIVNESEGELKVFNEQGVQINKFKDVEITYKLS
jgi:hypothetical protein